ncbi:MAG TPA: hypothetical protein VF189_02185 [Patescibacteria group bacterium]
MEKKNRTQKKTEVEKGGRKGSRRTNAEQNPLNPLGNVGHQDMRALSTDARMTDNTWPW